MGGWAGGAGRYRLPETLVSGQTLSELPRPGKIKLAFLGVVTRGRQAIADAAFVADDCRPVDVGLERAADTAQDPAQIFEIAIVTERR